MTQKLQGGSSQAKIIHNNSREDKSLRSFKNLGSSEDELFNGKNLSERMKIIQN